MDFSYCPTCGEPVDTGYTDKPGKAPCDNCGETVEPVTDPDNAEMPFKASHPIVCNDCNEEVKLLGLHMGEYTDGVIVGCDCSTLSSIPHELGEPELPDQWEIVHDTEV